MLPSAVKTGQTQDDLGWDGREWHSHGMTGSSQTPFKKRTSKEIFCWGDKREKPQPFGGLAEASDVCAGRVRVRVLI